MRIGTAVVVVALIAVVVSPPLEAQCAMCRTALEGSEQGQLLAAHFNRGILFLLGAPFAVAVWIAIAMVRSRRRLQIL
jgi:hypothetical protein